MDEPIVVRRRGRRANRTCDMVPRQLPERKEIVASKPAATATVEEKICDYFAELGPMPEWFDLPENWKDHMLGMFDEGCTNEEVIAWIAKIRKGKFTRNMFYHWYKRLPMFHEIVDLGNLYKKAWWLKQGRLNIGDSKFNTPLYVRMMMNLFAWRTENTMVESGERVDLTKLSEEELAAYKNLRDKMKSIAAEDGNGIVKKPDNGRAATEKVSQPEFAGTGRD